MRLALFAALALAGSSCSPAEAAAPAANDFPRGCRDRSCIRERVVPNAGGDNFSNCSCTQLSQYVVVRGYTEQVQQANHVGLCSLTGTFDSAQPGDFVVCPINTPRYMNGAILTEPTGSPTLRHNYVLYASQFDSTDWVKLQIGASPVPVVVANQAASPLLGAVTADLVTFGPSSGAGDLSVVVKSLGSGTSSACPLSKAHASGQVMIKGTTLDGGTTSGTLDMGIYDGAAWAYVACPFTGSAFTRCKIEDKATGGNGDFFIGNASAVTGTNRVAQSVYLALAGCEEGANASSPIDSTAALSNGQMWTRMPDIVTANGGTRTAWLGDSLSANTVESTTSAQVYPRAPERYASQSGRTVDNWAVNGATFISDIQNEWTNFGVRTGAQRIVMQGGFNDILISLTPGHTVWTAFQSFAAARIAEGRSVILINLTPFKGYSGYSAGLNTERLNFNSDMATYCTSVSGGPPAGVTCIDMAAAMWDPGDHDALLAANAAPDKLHYSQVGATLAGDTVFAGAP